MSGQGGSGGLAGLSIRRPWLAVVLNLLVVIAGIAAILGAEVRELPNIDRPVVTVRALYPGASPTTVDAEVTRVVEGAAARVTGVVAVRSSSEEGNFRMRVEFRPDVELADAASDLREAVSRITRDLPDGVEDLTVVKSDADADPVVRLAAWSGALDAAELTRRLEDDVLPELTGIAGVAEAQLDGARERVVRVDLLPERLAAYGLSVAEVAAVVRAAQFDVPVGSFEAGPQEILVRADATVTEPEAIEALKLRAPVRLGDVAAVSIMPREPEEIVRVNGREVIGIEIVRQAKANAVAISEGVERAVARIETRFPDMEIATVEDGAVFIESAIAEVLTSLAVALLIVVAVIWVFLGSFGATLVPAVAIPVALVGSVAGIWALGFSINLVTLLALVLATGLVVDDAIVVLENIQRKRREMGPRAAALIGTREVVFAVLATTATLIAVFVPISFLPSEAGRLFREFGFVLAITVGLSSFVALTLAPMIAARLPDLGGRPPAVLRGLGWVAARAYGGAMRAVLWVPLAVLTLAAMGAALAAVLYADLGQELVPPEDRGRVAVSLQGPDGTGLDYTDEQVERVEALFAPWIAEGVGQELVSITGRWDLNRGWITMDLADWEEREIAQSEIEADIAEGLDDIAGARARIRRGNTLGLRGGDGGLEIAITGPDYPTIAEAAFAFARTLEAEMPELESVRVQYQATQPQLSIGIDRAAAAELDVPVEAISQTLKPLVDEDEVAELTIGDTAAPVLLRAVAGAVEAPSDLLDLTVRARSGALVPLSQLVSFEEAGVAAELDRHAQRRAVEIDAGLPPELALAEAVERVRALAQERLPEGTGLLLLGEAASLEETSSAVAATYVIALLVVFLVLVAQFEGLTSALIVMVTVPFGVAAAVAALWLTGTTLNIYSQIGVLMLIGIMAKNGILLVEFADQMRDRGHPAHEAARLAAEIRLRPIAMTLASTVLAALPLVLGSGAGAEARAAIGWVIFGGLGIAAAVTLFVTPAVYALLAPLSRPRAAESAALEAELAALGRPAE